MYICHMVLCLIWEVIFLLQLFYIWCLLHLVLQVSREQHERVKSSMKYAGNSIQPRSLNNVLGSFDALNVQPFARFEEEESKKLHEHWLVISF